MTYYTMKKKGRGTIIEHISTIGDVDLSLVSWYDNKVVNTLSTYLGIVYPPGLSYTIRSRSLKPRLLTQQVY